MKTALISMLLLGIAALVPAACSADTDGSVGESVALPPNYDPSAAPSKLAQPATEAQAEEATAFDERLAARGEATAQAASPELERQLEAEYQAALTRTDDQNALLENHRHKTVDFDALFDKIRNTMPPARAVLLMEYVTAAERLHDPVHRTAMLQRLGSQELNNVR